MRGTTTKHTTQIKNPKILIIGLGQIGYSNAEYMSSMGLQVDGFDISKHAVNRALDAKVIQKSPIDFSGYDFYVICVSTHNPENMSLPSLNGLFSVIERIAKEGNTGALIGVDSTISRGTSSQIESMLNHRLHVVHVPHRYYVHEKNIHGVNQERVIGGCSECCVQKGFEFYQNVLKIPVNRVSTIEVAEMTKIVENSYRFMEIAFVEELKIICDRTGLSFRELRQAVNSKWNINLLEAKDGIGGHCLPKDSQMLLNISREFLPYSIIETAKKIDSNYRLHIRPQWANSIKKA
jgi:UDP-N-acetyl-D-mannosaminuronic acid dehydrogenase